VRCTGHLSAIFHQPLALVGIERAFDFDDALDLVEHPRLGFAFAQSCA